MVGVRSRDSFSRFDDIDGDVLRLASKLQQNPALAAAFNEVLEEDHKNPVTAVASVLSKAYSAGLQAELDEHLGYRHNDRTGKREKTTSNSRNGSYTRTINTEYGKAEVTMPRDREGTFASQLVPKHARRVDGFDSLIVNLVLGGMTTRDVCHFMQVQHGISLSPATVSTVVDTASAEFEQWQYRELSEFYPIIYLDAIRVSARGEAGHVIKKAAHIAIGIDIEGQRHVLGIWVQETEGARHWQGVCTDLYNRGVKDVLIVCCDGLTGLPAAVESVWHQAIVQTCVVHLIRAALRSVAKKDYQAVVNLLKPIYQAGSEAQAEHALQALKDSDMGRKYPKAAEVFERAWEEFVPFLSLPPEIRRVIYTTNMIESMNAQLRKATRNRLQFPTDESMVRYLWMAVRHVEEKETLRRNKKTKRATAKGLVEGTQVGKWKDAISQLQMAYPERFNKYM